jgi:hypothetical protein
VSLNETNTWRTTRARTIAQLRLFVARLCYADSWVRYGFQFLWHDGGDTSRHERFYWTTGTDLDADAGRAKCER